MVYTVFYTMSAVFLTSYFAYSYFVASGASRWVSLLLIAFFLCFAVIFEKFKKNKWRDLKIKPWVYGILFLFLVFLIEASALAFYTPEYLRHQFGAVVAYTGIHVIKLVSFYVFFTVGSFLIGDLVVRRFARSRDAVTGYIPVALGAGFMLVAVYYYALALVSFVYPVAIIPLLAIAAFNRDGFYFVLGFLRIIANRAREPVTLFSYESLFYASLVIIAAFIIIQNGWPVVVEGDSLALYFNLPYTILQNHHLVRFPYWSLGEGVNAFSFIYIPILTFGQPLLNFASFYFFCLSVPVLYILCANLLSKEKSFLVLWLYLTIPLQVSWLFLTPKVDHLMIFFVLISSLSAIKMMDTMRPWIAIFTGLSLAFAIAVKFNAALAVPIVYMLALNDWKQTFFDRKRLMIIFFMTAGFFLSFFLWSLRPLYYHGDPLYPYSGIKNYKVHTTVTYTADDEKFMDAFLNEADYYTANFGYSYSLRQNIRNFFMTSLRYPSFNYGLIVIFAFASLFIFHRANKKIALIICMVYGITIVWYFLIRSQAHYIDFLNPFFAILAAWFLSSCPKFFETWALTLVAVIVVINISLSSFMPSTFIAHAVSVTAVNRFPAYVLREGMNDIVSKQPNAVFLSLTRSLAPFNESYRHVFYNPVNYYLAYVTHRTSSAQEAIEQMKKDGITHILYSEDITSYVLLRCEKLGHRCPLYQQMAEKISLIIQNLTKVMERGTMTIYQL